MINSPVLLSIYRTTCRHFIPTTIFYSIKKDWKDKDYQGSNRQEIVCFDNPIKMALGVIEGKEATK